MARFGPKDREDIGTEIVSERYWRKNRFRTLDTRFIRIPRITAHSVRSGASLGSYPAHRVQDTRYSLQIAFWEVRALREAPL